MTLAQRAAGARLVSPQNVTNIAFSLYCSTPFVTFEKKPIVEK